ncbi:MAG: response regulator [Ignavibacteriales bacterium]|nr:response regulator [Ignavibacteriales bacterium]
MSDYYGDRITILIIDDSDIIRNSLRNFLSEYELEVITCNDGLEGIQKAIEYKPKLIFLDLMMPNLDGLRMLKVIKILDDLKNLPVIVISGHTDKNNVLAAMHAGAVKVLSKPLSKDVLYKCINEVMGKDFLEKARKTRYLTELEKEEIDNQLKKYFLMSLPQRKETIKFALKNRNADLLKTVLHEIKGTSGMIGYSNISNMCAESEYILSDINLNWSDIENKCELLINEFEVLEILNSK